MNDPDRCAESDTPGNASTAELTETLYGELRDIAMRHFRSERRDHTLQPTALVNEAFLRLQRQSQTEWKNSEHVRGIASQLMRRILIDYARGKQAAKRGAGYDRIALTLAPITGGDDPVEISVVHDLLEQLAELNPRHAQVVQCRVFGGLTLPEIATHLDLSLATIKNDWRFARAWLLAQLSEETPADE